MRRPSWASLTKAPLNLAVALRRGWRRSLQLRVVSLTLVSSIALVVTFGLVVGNLITNGLVESSTEAAYKQVVAGSQYASQQVGSIQSATEPSLQADLKNVVVELANRAGTSSGSGITVAVIPDPASVRPAAVAWPNEEAYADVPQSLQAATRGNWGFASQRLVLDLDGKGPRLYLVFGRTLAASWGTIQLYHFFPLEDEVAAATLVRNTLVATGLTLVIMLALLAALVTRIVVRPVRLAARTAQRLAAGLLDQRMQVRGEDDLAALAASFNQMAENLQRQIQRLEEMSRLQRRFTSDVSHELRTPLTTVRMAADLIFAERQDFEPPVARSAELLQNELDRFEGLLTDLLEISRFDAGFAVLDAEPTNLVPIVDRVIDRLGTVAGVAGVEIAVRVPDGPVIAEVDPRRVERILRNLIGNAVEHAEGQPVHVTLAADDGAVAVTVRDHGLGLRPGEDKLVFNRFWRSDPSRARQTGGTGLGLSISLEDARLHGGWLEAWGAPGEGAQFRLTLPARARDRLTASPLPLVPNGTGVLVASSAPLVPGTEKEDAERDNSDA